MLHRRLAIAGIAISVVLAFGVPDGARAESTLGDVDPKEIRDAKPGSILRMRPVASGWEYRAKVYHILFRSTGPKGEPIIVSGAIIVPLKPAPKEGRPVVAWAHPTTGVVDDCAPTLRPDLPRRIPGLWDMIERGYIVAATDYQGPGPPIVQPFLIGESEARAVLDSVRAAGQLPGTNAQKRFAVWGHSQGGHAALFTGQLAASYAPELELVGVAAAAPATYLEQLFDADHRTSSGKTLTAMALLSWSKVFEIPLDSILARDAHESFKEVAHDCIETILELLEVDIAVQPLQHEEFLKANPTKVEPWASIMQRNSPGKAPAGAPVFIAQGTADTVVSPHVTKKFVEHLCGNGTSVKFVAIEGAGHMFAARDSASKAVAWIADRFRGHPAPSDCADQTKASLPAP